MDLGLFVLIRLGSQQYPLDLGSGVFGYVVSIMVVGSAVPLYLHRIMITTV
jgi:hypothetical protein